MDNIDSIDNEEIQYCIKKLAESIRLNQRYGKTVYLQSLLIKLGMTKEEAEQVINEGV